jgi:hypothetical protein
VINPHGDADMIRLASHLVVVVLASTCAVQHAAAQEAAPPPLHEEGVALDVARHRVVLYGGTRAEGESYVNAGETWEWDGCLRCGTLNGTDGGESGDQQAQGGANHVGNSARVDCWRNLV